MLALVKRISSKKDGLGSDEEDLKDSKSALRITTNQNYLFVHC